MATVPCAAITNGSSKGATHTNPSRCWSASATAMASRRSSPCSTTVAPRASVLRTFTLGVKRGITMVAGMPRRVAW